LPNIPIAKQISKPSDTLFDFPTAQNQIMEETRWDGDQQEGVPGDMGNEA